MSTDKTMNPQEWFKYNWDFYLGNKKYYQQNKRMLQIKEALTEGGQNFSFWEIGEDGVETRENEFSSTDEENLKDIEYKAYYHYFVAKQNTYTPEKSSTYTLPHAKHCTNIHPVKKIAYGY